eukprot:2030898-Karenia_brevis.AAC.1
MPVTFSRRTVMYGLTRLTRLGVRLSLRTLMREREEHNQKFSFKGVGVPPGCVPREHAGYWAEQ